jgi:hypothetical protein
VDSLKKGLVCDIENYISAAGRDDLNSTKWIRAEGCDFWNDESEWCYSDRLLIFKWLIHDGVNAGDVRLIGNPGWM